MKKSIFKLIGLTVLFANISFAQTTTNETSAKNLIYASAGAVFNLSSVN